MTALQQILEQETDLSSPSLKDAVYQVIDLLDKGQLRVAEKIQGTWLTHAWIKQAIILYFRLEPLCLSAIPMTSWYDKIPLKYQDWDQAAFEAQGARIVPGALVRKGAYVAPRAILMPSYLNVGSYVGEGTMIDTWSTVGSCAQVGNNCHISGGVGLGGVLEPVGASPVIIEDDCFIGARSEVVEGVIVEQGCVLAMGTFIGQSTKIVERDTGVVYQGRVPAYSVVVPGSLPSSGGVHLNCAVIVKRVDEKTRGKVSLNELLRD